MSAMSIVFASALRPRNLFHAVAVLALAVALSGGAPAVYADCNDGDGSPRPCLDAVEHAGEGSAQNAGPGQ